MLRELVRQYPANASFRSNLSGLLSSLGRDGEALEHLQTAIDLDPGFAQAHLNMGMLLDRLQRANEAVDVLETAVRLAPDQVRAHTALASARLNLGENLAAEAICREAIKRWPNDSTAHQGLALSLLDQRRLHEATASFLDAIRLNPKGVDAHANLGVALLMQGQWERGWKEFEWRRRLKPGLHRPGTAWSGQDLSGKTILVFAEGGMGNAVQFARFVPLLAEMGACVILQAHHKLRRLFESLDGSNEFVGLGQPLPRYDFYCPLMSVPSVLGITVDSLPAPCHYLVPNSERMLHWKRRLSDIKGVRVGVCWQGDQRLVYRRNRSIPSDAFAPLRCGGRVSLISLQKGVSTPDLPVIEFPGLDDGGAFVDTAAIIRNLDLVVTCDTSIVHVAGALGAETWVALHHVSDWCWLLERPDTPWYPSVRLFRQAQTETWRQPFGRMVDELVQRYRLG